jgi:hypothetical protein
MSLIVRQLIEAGAPDDEIERLLTHWGGLPVYVPMRADPDHQIARIAGQKVAEVLSRLYGGERILMPLGAAFRRERLRRRIAELKAAGLNNCEIARRLGVHLRQVQRLSQVDQSHESAQKELDL